MPEFTPIELPTDLIGYLEGIEEHVQPTDQCLDTFDMLQTLAEAMQTIDFETLAEFVRVCVGG
jgi:hypothetical protein